MTMNDYIQFMIDNKMFEMHNHFKLWFNKYFEIGYKLNADGKVEDILNLSAHSKICLTICAGVFATIILGILVILCNQRRIKKQLKQLLEAKEITSSSNQTTIDEDGEMP